MQPISPRIPAWKKRISTGILATMTSVKLVPPMARNVQLEFCAPIAGWASSAVVALNLNNICITEGTKIFPIIITTTTTITSIIIISTTPKIHQRAAVCASVWITRRKTRPSPTVRVISTVTSAASIRHWEVRLHRTHSFRRRKWPILR